MGMIKAVFFDIDGTLIDQQSRVLQSTRDAIRKMQQNGIICGIATGRGPLSLGEEVKNLGLDVMVTYNGQYVYTPTQVIYAHAFSSDVIKKVVRFADRHRLQLLLGAADETDGSSFLQMGEKKWMKVLERLIPKAITKRMSKPFKWFFRSFPKKMNEKEKYQKLSILAKPIYQCVALCPEEKTGWLEKELPECDFTRSNPYTVDIIPKKGSKIIGIEHAIAAFGIKMEEVMAFGDSWNDEEMLKSVGVGIAMGNAMTEIQELADDVTDTHNNHGISKALIKHQVIDEGGEQSGRKNR